MAIANPIFGLDVSDNQPLSINFAGARRQGYEFCVARITGGMDAGGHIYIDRNYQNFLPRIAGKIVMVDYERYRLNPGLTCTIQVLKDYIRTLRAHIGPAHLILIYSQKSFWEEPPRSGRLSDYGTSLQLWNAWYWVGEDQIVSDPQGYYRRSQSWEGTGYWQSFSGTRPFICQFLGSGEVGGDIVDVNACRGTRDQLAALTKG